LWYSQDADDRSRRQDAFQTIRTNAHNAIYDKDAVIEGEYHMEMREEEKKRKAHA